MKPELTLMKEDMLLYHFFVFMKDRVRSIEMKHMQQITTSSCFTYLHFFHLQLMGRTTEVDSTTIEGTEDAISNSYTKVDTAEIKGNLCRQNEAFGLQEKSTMM